VFHPKRENVLRRFANVGAFSEGGANMRDKKPTRPQVGQRRRLARRGATTSVAGLNRQRRTAAMTAAVKGASCAACGSSRRGHLSDDHFEEKHLASRHDEGRSTWQASATYREATKPGCAPTVAEPWQHEPLQNAHQRARPRVIRLNPSSCIFELFVTS